MHAEACSIEESPANEPVSGADLAESSRITGCKPHNPESVCKLNLTRHLINSRGLQTCLEYKHQNLQATQDNLQTPNLLP